MQSALAGLTVRDGMMTRFRTLAPADPLDRAVDELLAGSQQDFPVVDHNGIAGVLRRNDLVRGLKAGTRDLPVGDFMCRGCLSFDEAESLRHAVEAMQAGQCASSPVLRDGRLVGLLTLENISEMIMIHEALAGHAPAAAR